MWDPYLSPGDEDPILPGPELMTFDKRMALRKSNDQKKIKKTKLSF